MFYAEYLKGTTDSFHGKWDGKTKFRNHSAKHSFLIVGTRQTPGDMGDMALLVEDSTKDRPFKEVGYALLLSMGVTEVLKIKPDLSLRTTSQVVVRFHFRADVVRARVWRRPQNLQCKAGIQTQRSPQAPCRAYLP